MNTRTLSEWHACGTRAPSRHARTCLALRILMRRSIKAVPQRATSGVSYEAKRLVIVAFRHPGGVDGTQWHGGSRESNSDHGRAR